MIRPEPNLRHPEYDVDAVFTDRWSPRAFEPAPLDDAQVATLFEAARWAPSCFNEQPWLFRYALSEADRGRFLTALVEKNRAWARHAPMLIFILARKQFALTGKPNRHAPFDAGAAWMSLALQARRLGLHAHAMAGFSVVKALEVLGVDGEEFDVMAAVAVGRRADPGNLPEDLAEGERPNHRKPHAEVAQEG